MVETTIGIDNTFKLVTAILSHPLVPIFGVRAIRLKLSPDMSTHYNNAKEKDKSLSLTAHARKEVFEDIASFDRCLEDWISGESTELVSKLGPFISTPEHLKDFRDLSKYEGISAQCHHDRKKLGKYKKMFAELLEELPETYEEGQKTERTVKVAARSKKAKDDRMELDNYTCVLPCCSIQGKHAVEVHHIHGIKEGTVSLDDLITLCPTHHRSAIHRYGYSLDQLMEWEECLLAKGEAVKQEQVE